jgi:hypothetical protein
MIDAFWHASCDKPFAKMNKGIGCPLLKQRWDAIWTVYGEAKVSHRHSETLVEARGSRELFAYWAAIKGSRRAPSRQALEPTAIKHILCDMFILDTEKESSNRLRIAGTRVSAWFGYDLKGHTFEKLWDKAQLEHIKAVIKAVTTQGIPVILQLEAEAAHGDCAKLEMLLLPLEHQGEISHRVLGNLATTKIPSWLGISPVKKLIIKSVKPIRPDQDNDPLSEPTIKKRHANLKVYEGGRKD